MIWLLAAALAASPDELLAEARRAERAGDAAAELAACQELLATAPPQHGSRGRCGPRVAHLLSRQDADGGFLSYTQLNALRHLPRDEARPRAEALYRAPSTPEGLRIDLALWLARDAQQAGQDPRPFLEDWPGAEPAQRAARDSLLSAVTGQESRAQEARTTGSTRRIGAALSAITLAVFAIVCPPLAWRARALRPRPVGLALLGVLGLGAALIAWRWEAESGRATLAMLPPLALVHGLSLWGILGSRRPGALRALVGLSTLAVAYLTLWRFELLDRVGL